MTSKLTNGISVSVLPIFRGTFQKDNILQYVFSYEIVIENFGEFPIQIDSRYWEIYDTFKEVEIVEGKGVVGEQPIIFPKDKYTYNSGCILTSTTGAMVGYYNVLNLTDNRFFTIEIPLFKLTVPYLLN